MSIIDERFIWSTEENCDIIKKKPEGNYDI